MATAAELTSVLMRFLDSDKPIPETMRDDERKRGFRVIYPGRALWFPLADWSPDCVVSMDGGVVRLVLIVAANQGSGALRRLIANIRAFHLTPMIIAPTRELAATLRRWGWKSVRAGSTFEDTEDQWTP